MKEATAEVTFITSSDQDPVTPEDLLNGDTGPKEEAT